MNTKVIEEMKKERKTVISSCIDHPKEPSCSRIYDDEDSRYCKVYFDPVAAWRRGDCPMADIHLRKDYQESQAQEKVRVGQQKQKKKK